MVLAHNIEDGERTQDVQISQGVTFDSMLLSADTLAGLHNTGFYKPSPIQLHGIPLGKCGFDLLLEAKSGTGKTAVFTVIALEQLNITKGLQTVILAPTREIAAQICDVIKQIGSHYEGLKVEVVMGGLPIHEDIAKFKHNDIHIVVGSPGRLRHLIHNEHIDVSFVRLFILDEADKLLEKSFLSDINFIYSNLPEEKQVILSSATYPTATKSIIEQYVKSAQHVCPDSNSILIGIKQKITIVKSNSNIVLQTKNRFEELIKILSKLAFKQCLIFCNYQVRVAEVYKLLQKKKWPAEQLYGKQEQLERLDALRSLQEYKCRILISTDLAARGIDASNVDLIINFEPPYEWQTYLHRIGRAGRFGSYGIAITILSKGREEQSFREILNTIKMPFNLTKLWDEKDHIITTDYGVETSPNLQMFRSPPEESIPVNNKSTENIEILWNALTHQKKATDIEDFESLCLSYNSLEQSESFSDLLTSFESYQSTEAQTNHLYNHLEMESLYIPDYTTLYTTKATTEGIQAINKIILEINNNKFGNSFKEKGNKTDLINYSNGSEHYVNKKDTNELKYENIINEDSKSLEAALLNAGLPVSFGKPKLTKKESQAEYSKCDSYCHNHQNNDFNNRQRNKNKSNSSVCKKYAQGLDTKEEYCNSRIEKSIRVKNYSEIENEQSKPYGAETYSKSDNTYKIDIDQFEESEGSDSDEENYKVRKSSYLSWYNNLKFRTKEVEYAIYMEEMFKLQ